MANWSKADPVPVWRGSDPMARAGLQAREIVPLCTFGAGWGNSASPEDYRLEFRLRTRMTDTFPSRKTRKTQGNQAFDVWLKRGLHQLFDDVVNEPMPEELLRLIQEDREKQD
jgi:hypothetical protein